MKAQYSEDGSKKLCKGALHREGVFVPVHRFHVHKSGRLEGKLYFECSDCWRLRQGRTDENISADVVEPMVERLVARLGSQVAVCRRLGVPLNSLSMFKRYAHVRSSFVNKLIALDNELQKEIQKSWQYTMEPLVVAAEPLGRILREFCKEWVNQYPKGRFNFNSYYYGPQDFIAEKTGFEIRQIGRICNSEKQFVALSQADAILTVIGNSDFTTNGVIQVIVNPTWSLEAYMAYMKERGCI